MHLKEFRERLNLTQRELSDVLAIAQTAIARYENDKVKPTTTVIMKYVNELNANPNFLFLGMEPHLLRNIPKIDSLNMNYLNDILLVMSQEELKEKLSKILIEEIIQRFEKQNDSLVIKLLGILRMDQFLKVRPFLFLYYIFQQIRKDLLTSPKEISDYKQYLGDIIINYKVLDWKNQPGFTDQIKNEIRDFLDIKLTSQDCEVLVTNHKSTLEILEQKMSPTMIRYNRNVYN